MSHMKDLKVGDVVQVNPESQLGAKQGFFAACLVIVDEIKAWGVQGFVQVPGARGELPSRAYGRFNWADIEYVGRCQWILQQEESNDENPTPLRDV